MAIPLVTLLAIAACGSAAEPAANGSAGTGVADQSVIREFATATDAGTACDQLSSGFRLFVGDGDFSRTACIAHFAQKFTAPWAAKRVTFGATTQDHDQRVVQVTVDGAAQQFYLIEQYDTVKINSIGIREGTGPSPPPSSVYAS